MAGRRRGQPSGAKPRSGAALGLFGEVALAGVLVGLGSLLLVTAVPSLAAGVAHVRRQVTGHDIGVRRFVHEWWAAVRALWPLGLAAVGIALLLVLDWWLAGSGALPGAKVVAAAVALAAAVLVVVLARAAGVWSQEAAEDGERPWTARQVLAEGARQSREDVPGSLLLVFAAGLCVVFVWMLPPLVILVGGLMSLAVVGVESRRGVTPTR